MDTYLIKTFLHPDSPHVSKAGNAIKHFDMKTPLLILI